MTGCLVAELFQETVPIVFVFRLHTPTQVVSVVQTEFIVGYHAHCCAVVLARICHVVKFYGSGFAGFARIAFFVEIFWVKVLCNQKVC